MRSPRTTVIRCGYAGVECTHFCLKLLTSSLSRGFAGCGFEAMPLLKEYLQRGMERGRARDGKVRPSVFGMQLHSWSNNRYFSV